MMPVRWLTRRSRTRCSACRSSCSAVLVATNFIVGRWTDPADRPGDRLGIAEVVLLALGVGANILCRHQSGVVTKSPEHAAQVVRADAGFHADQAGRHVGKSYLDLAARPPLSQHHRATAIQADDMERGLADIDPDDRNLWNDLLGHGVLLCPGCPVEDYSPAG